MDVCMAHHTVVTGIRICLLTLRTSWNYNCQYVNAIGTWLHLLDTLYPPKPRWSYSTFSVRSGNAVVIYFLEGIWLVNRTMCILHVLVHDSCRWYDGTHHIESACNKHRSNFLENHEQFSLHHHECPISPESIAKWAPLSSLVVQSRKIWYANVQINQYVTSIQCR